MNKRQPTKKEDILKMSKEELSNYKWSDELDIKESKKDARENENCYNCFYCSDCYNCFYCSDCSNLANGLYCRNLNLEKKDYDKYYICNEEITKEEFEQKKKELEK